MNDNNTSVSSIIKMVMMTELHRIKNKFIKSKRKDIKYRSFHSQFGEDRYIFENIELPESGVYVDVGAGHPKYLSNTYFFERNGWTGVCIDADPVRYELLRKYRANVEWAAISNKGGNIEFSKAYLSDYSSLVKKEKYSGIAKILFKNVIRVPCLDLETILTKHKIGIIDLLSIDVEGTELDVWNSFDYEKHKPKVVVIEFYTFGLPDNSRKIRDLFSHLSYKLVHTTSTNFIFLRNEAS